ncbi:MAG TPA: hypothetical protein VGO86_17525 [Candidatus Dormibacteraeota bacterium]|jgi:hypothetical protein
MSNRATPTVKVRTKTAVRRQVETRAHDPRPGAVPSPEMVNLFEEVLSPEARLLAKAWVRNVAYDKKVWLDVDLLGQRGQPLHSETLALEYLEAAGGTGDFFLAEVPVRPSTPKERRAAAHGLRYRLYYEVGGTVFTDGICHQHQLSS